MNTSRVAHLRVAPHNIAMRSVQGRLGQRAHALIMKSAKENVTPTLQYRCVDRERNGFSKTFSGVIVQQHCKRPAEQ